MQKGSCKRFDGLSFCRRSDEANGETSPDQATAIPEAMSAGSVGTNSILSSLSSEKIKSSWHNEHLCCNQCQTNFFKRHDTCAKSKKKLVQDESVEENLETNFKTYHSDLCLCLRLGWIPVGWEGWRVGWTAWRDWWVSSRCFNNVMSNTSNFIPF